MQITSYFNQLLRAAAAKEIRLKDAFLEAGLNSSVYYRALRNGTLHLATAERVMCVISTK